MTAMSDNAKAFSAKLDGLVQEHAASARAVEQRWKETSDAASKSASEVTEKAQKLVARVRERAQFLRAAEAKNAADEIEVGGEELEADEVAPEIERFSQQLVAGEKARAAEADPAPAAGPAATSSQWQGRPGGFGEPTSGGPYAPSPAAPQAPAAEAAPAGWQVQAGRFGRGDRQPPPAQAPPVPTPPPAAPKPAPRRQPAFDEDDDFENESWLR